MARTARPIRIEGDIAYIPLTKGYEAVIDAADVPLVDGVCWTAAEDGHTVYAYRRTKAEGHLRLHRVIIGAARDVLVDHRDGDGLNNRRGNIRCADSSQNGANMRTPIRNKSGFKGVRCRKNGWESQIIVRGRYIYLGRFRSAELAHAAYVTAAERLHGEFARVS